MTNKLTIILAALLIAGCAPSKPKRVATVMSDPVLQQKVPACWHQAGLKGDLYKFMTPGELQGITSISGASDQQVAQFKACVAA